MESLKSGLLTVAFSGGFVSCWKSRIAWANCWLRFWANFDQQKFTAGAREFSKMVVVLKECPGPFRFLLNYPTWW